MALWCTSSVISPSLGVLTDGTPRRRALRRSRFCTRFRCSCRGSRKRTCLHIRLQADPSTAPMPTPPDQVGEVLSAFAHSRSANVVTVRYCSFTARWGRGFSASAPLSWSMRCDDVGFSSSSSPGQVRFADHAYVPLSPPSTTMRASCREEHSHGTAANATKRRYCHRRDGRAVRDRSRRVTGVAV